jgi:hypothetical protein
VTPVDAGQLGRALRRVVVSARRDGDDAGWQPAPGSTALQLWEHAPHDALARTVVEAEMSATLLARSALEHAAEVADAITGRKSWVPHTLGRTAVEHALRAKHQLDDLASDLTRAARRLNEWMYAIDEAAKLRKGLQQAGHPGSEELPDLEADRERVRARARELGLAISAEGNRVGSEGRAKTINLAERYLAGEHQGAGTGVPSWQLRRYAAMDHGTETALLLATAAEVGPAGVTLLVPEAMPVPELAFELMAVPLAVINSHRALRHRFEWPASKAATVALDDQNRLLEIWEAAMTEHLDTRLLQAGSAPACSPTARSRRSSPSHATRRSKPD